MGQLVHSSNSIFMKGTWFFLLLRPKIMYELNKGNMALYPKLEVPV